MSYPVIIIENLPYVCETMSLKPALMNVMEHLMDFHMPLFRLERVSENCQQLILDSADDFITEGKS